MSKFVKVKPSQIKIDARYQRDFDEKRAEAMSRNIDTDRIGVPVLSLRADGTFHGLDGQHRIQALNMAGLGDTAILCEVHEGLSLKQESALFLKLNNGRKAVGELDKFKAGLVARDPVYVEIDKIVRGLGLRVTKSGATNCISAILSVRSVHLKYGNLEPTLRVLIAWGDGDSSAFNGELVKDMGCFLATYPSIDIDTLVRRLGNFAPDRVIANIRRMRGGGNDIPRYMAACNVLREIYNKGRVKQKLPPPPTGGPGKVSKKRVVLKAA